MSGTSKDDRATRTPTDKVKPSATRSILAGAIAGAIEIGISFCPLLAFQRED